jgi:hypothetical protein
MKLPLRDKFGRFRKAAPRDARGRFKKRTRASIRAESKTPIRDEHGRFAPKAETDFRKAKAKPSRQHKFRKDEFGHWIDPIYKMGELPAVPDGQPLGYSFRIHARVSATWKYRYPQLLMLGTDQLLETWRTPVVAELKTARENLNQLLREKESIRENASSFKVLIIFLVTYYKRSGIYYYKEKAQ